MISVTCAIIRKNGLILAAQRPADSHLAGKWEFPGGKLDRNETEEACIVREIREELGLDVQPARRLQPSTHDYGEKVIRLIPFECEVVSGDPVAHEHAAIKWVAPADLDELNWCEADIPIVEQIKRASH